MGDIPKIATLASGSHVVCTALNLAQPKVREIIINLLSKSKVLRKLSKKRFGQQVLNHVYNLASIEQQRIIRDRMASLLST